MQGSIQWLRRKKRGALRRLRPVVLRLCAHLPLQKKVVFDSYYGRYFCDSPREIYEELRRRKLGYRFVWLSVKGNAAPKGASIVPSESLRACYHLATARAWVDNVRKPEWVEKRGDQIYVQTWHSGLTNKSGEGDEEPKLNRDYVRTAKRDSGMADLFVSGSAWQTRHYRRAFWYDGEILESGLPRTDLFFRPAAPVRAKVARALGLAGEERLVLYAPTFRDDGSTEVYDLDFAALVRALQGRFGGSWRVLMRLHPNLVNLGKQLAAGEDVIDVSLYPDINELIVASDWLITDYSSCIFDALEAGKRGAIYAPDLAAYRRERGFYWEFEQLPLHLSETNGDLCAYIEGFDGARFDREVASFLADCGLFDDGRASARVVNRMLEMMEARRAKG